jgi:hypothetical protein
MLALPLDALLKVRSSIRAPLGVGLPDAVVREIILTGPALIFSVYISAWSRPETFTKSTTRSTDIAETFTSNYTTRSADITETFPTDYTACTITETFTTRATNIAKTFSTTATIHYNLEQYFLIYGHPSLSSLQKGP